MWKRRYYIHVWFIIGIINKNRCFIDQIVFVRWYVDLWAMGRLFLVLWILASIEVSRQCCIQFCSDTPHREKIMQTNDLLWPSISGWYIPLCNGEWISTLMIEWGYLMLPVPITTGLVMGNNGSPRNHMDSALCISPGLISTPFTNIVYQVCSYRNKREWLCPTFFMNSFPTICSRFVVCECPSLS